MTKGNPSWEQFERYVQQLLNLRSTPGSGNQWHDVGDGKSQVKDSYKLIVDCKHTDNRGYNLSGRDLQGWYDKSTGLGYHFALPIRLVGLDGQAKDWALVPFDDYAELVDAIRELRERHSDCG